MAFWQDKKFAEGIAKIQVLSTLFWFAYFPISWIYFNKYPHVHSNEIILLCVPGIFLGLGLSGLVTGVMVSHAGWSWRLSAGTSKSLIYSTGWRAYTSAFLAFMMGSALAWKILGVIFEFKTPIP